jgi:predicted DNA binding CopG/RHH family protein
VRRMKLTRYEKQVEKDLLNGVYVEGPKEETEQIRAAIEEYRKNAILHIRISEAVLKKLKEKAKKVGVKYQTFIAEALRRVAHS